MPAYVINDMIGSEPAPFEEYKRLAPEEVVRFGGRYLVSGGHSEKLEGDWTPRRLVILEFPSLDQARAWIDSRTMPRPGSCGCAPRCRTRWWSNVWTPADCSGIGTAVAHIEEDC